MKALFFLLTLSSIHAQTIQRHLESIVYRYASETHVPLYIADNLVNEESGWCQWAHNRVAGGLMALNYTYHAEYRDKYNGGQEFSEFDPEASVRIGLHYLAHLHDWLGTWRRALYFYNCGYSANVKKSVRRYADRILEGK